MKMKRIRAFLIGLLLVSGHVFGLNAVEIMEKADEIMKIRTSLSVSTMTITTTSGSQREFLMWGMAMGNRMVSKFASGLVKGLTMLSLDDGDEIWVYFRSSGRTRRLASHAKHSGVAGSDFSYDDMANTKYSRTYQCKLLETNDTHYQLELIPKKDQTPYQKLLVQVRKDNFVPEKILYFNKEGEKFKQFIIKEIQTISGILTPMYYEMKNLLSESVTTIKMKRIKYVPQLKKVFFSTNGLSRSLETWKATYPFFGE
ncbi:MAG: outer membrane lipoprotein-sorting protein [Candidatus Aminicenantes bacterium]|nr:MAG: outer membrane lipoprotein-sorting protein [Candidatus Aminicenantes bacterium]